MDRVGSAWRTGQTWYTWGMLRVTSLASGSSGNAFLVETPHAPLLIEAGLSARTLERLLRQRGIDAARLSAIVVSHEHHDHAQGAGPLARRWGIPVVCTPLTRAALGGELAGVEWLALGTEGVTVGDVELWGFPVPHDAVDPQGIVLQHADSRVGWALDLGHVPPHVPAALADADLVIVEANHDRELLMAAPYPWSTKHRILSDRGHLSNLQASELLVALGAAKRSRTAWLAHLSANTNDHPRRVLRNVQLHLEMAEVGTWDLAIAERDKPSAQWQSEQLRQQPLLELGD